jgi:predicted HAD superfamily Cof-like phosphohydrolase
MNKLERDVANFMSEMGQRRMTAPDMYPTPQLLDFRTSLITEEFDETIDAMLQLKRPDLTPHQRMYWMSEVADGVVDLIYVLIGTTLSLGIDIEEVWDEVHRANLAKTDGPIREDGKRLKPEGWEPPNVFRIIAEQLAESDFADRSIKG